MSFLSADTGIILPRLHPRISLPGELFAFLFQQIFFCAGGVLKNGPDYLAAIQFLAVSASINSLFIYAFTDLAIIAAKRKFRPICPAAHTIDSSGCNLWRIVHYAPFPGGLFPQLIVICNCSYTGVATFTIQSAAGNQLFHQFAILYRKYSGNKTASKDFSFFAYITFSFRQTSRSRKTEKNSFVWLLQGIGKCLTLVH